MAMATPGAQAKHDCGKDHGDTGDPGAGRDRVGIEGGGLIEKGGDAEGNAGAPGGDEGGPGPPGLADDGANGRDAGEIEQYEQQVSEGPGAAIETGLHGAYVDTPKDDTAKRMNILRIIAAPRNTTTVVADQEFIHYVNAVIG